VPLGKRTRLELHNIHLQHVCEHDDKRQVGAALFLLGGAAASLHSCTLSSTRGFGIWMVQKSTCELLECTITDCGRTGLVGLGTGSATLQRSAVNNCAVHGVCVRGSTSLLAEGNA
jgi:Right handed beta helix region